MADPRKHDCDHDELTPELVPHRKLDDGDKAEPKHTEADPLVPVVPVG